MGINSLATTGISGGPKISKFKERIIRTWSTWTTTPMPATKNWISLAYNGNTFFASDSSTTYAVTSPDAINWTVRTGPGTLGAQISGGNNQFTGCVYNSSVAYSSPDGITWTTRSLPSSNYWFLTSYAYDRWFAIGTNTAYSQDVGAYSTNGGATWTALTMPTGYNTFGSPVIYSNGIYMTNATNYNYVMTSTNGTTWTLRTTVLPSGSNIWITPAVDDKGMIFIPTRGTLGATSTDGGLTWTSRTQLSGQWGDCAWGNGGWTIVGYTDVYTLTSPDAITWTQRTQPDFYYGSYTTYGNNIMAHIPYGLGSICISRV